MLCSWIRDGLGEVGTAGKAQVHESVAMTLRNQNDELHVG